MLEGLKENDISRELVGRSDLNEKLFIENFWVYLSYKIVQTYFAQFRRKSIIKTNFRFSSNRGISRKTRISQEVMDRSGPIEKRL